MSKIQKKGFTLIEVLLVVAIIAILAGIVLVALNPQQQIQQSNDAQRKADVNAILNAIGQYGIANGGDLSGLGLSSTAAIIGSDTVGGDVDLCSSLLVPTYIAALPFDPSHADAGYTSCAAYDTQYNALIDANNRVTVCAPNAQIATSICATR